MRSVYPAVLAGCCVREADDYYRLAVITSRAPGNAEGLLCKGLSLAAAFAY